MERPKKITLEIKKKSFLTFLYERGYSVAQVKEQIISDLKSYFNDHQNLEKDAINFVVSDSVNLLRLCLPVKNAVFPKEF